MADFKISQLPTASSVADHNEIPLNQDGVTKKATLETLNAESGLTDHLADADIHAPLDDTATDDAHVWSAEKIIEELAEKAEASHVHDDGDGLTGIVPISKGGTGLDSISAKKLFGAQDADTPAEIGMGTGLDMDTGSLIVVPNTTVQQVITSLAGTETSTRSELNFIEGSGIEITITDNVADARTDITIESVVGATPYPAGYIAGLAPTYNSVAGIVLPAGLRCSDSLGTSNLIVATAQTVALSSSGANGLDTGSEASNTWYYVYIIGDSNGVNATKGLFSTVNESVTGSVTMPSGYDLKRQLPIAVRNDGSSNLIPFAVGEGWPYRPRIHYDVPYRGYSATGTAGVTEFLTNGSSTSFAAASAAAFIPPLSRLAFFILCNAGSANGVAIRPTGSSHTGIEVAGSNTGNPPPIPCKTNSSQSIDYDKMYGAGANIWLAVESFVVTEM